MTSTRTPTMFSGNFTQQEPLSDEAIAAAVKVMSSGRLHRYNIATPDELSETALLEMEFASYQNQPYCLSCASGGYAIQLALRARGLSADEPVLTNAFTLSPVPGAIAAVGGKAVLVETTDDLVIDLNDLKKRILESQSKLLLLSHMRGHLADMNVLTELLAEHDVDLIEDCAHTMGASFAGQKSGTHGLLACFSTQTYKHINSGEGGLLTSSDATMMARAILLSGSYMLYERHQASPPAEVFDELRLNTPNCSGRMDNLRAAILRPQLRKLDDNGQRWNARYDALAGALKLHGDNTILLPRRHPQAHEIPSSIQFRIPHFSDDQHRRFLANCEQRGVELKWFGAADPKAYTSRYDSWQYLDPMSLPATDELLHRLYDCRIPLTFSVDDCRQIGTLIANAASEIG